MRVRIKERRIVKTLKLADTKSTLADWR